MPTKLSTRIEFLQFGPDDTQRLSDLRPVFEVCGDELVAAFYKHLRSFPETSALLTDPKVRDRLLLIQRSYLLSLCDCEINEQYVADRRAIGEAHVRVGLEPQWYFGAYSLYFSLLAPKISAHYQDDPEKAQLALVSLQRILMLDAQLAIEAYGEVREERLGLLAKELAESGRGLAEQVDLQRHQLRQTTQRARAAEQLASVGTVAAGLAHEIGTPMGVIRGYAELLEGSISDSASRDRLQTIIDQIDRISNIMQGLLNLTHPHEPQRDTITLSDVVDTALSFLSEKARRHGVEVVREYQETPQILGDSDKLQQLFLNLILNAFDAMDSGGLLRVEIGRADPRHMEIRFEDNGAGIPPGDLERVFDPFFTSKRSGQGSGLGLVVAQGIAGDHGGRIEVESEIGKGTRFRVLLPI